MPAALYDCPFQVYGNWLVQIEVLVVLVSVVLTVRFRVTILSQPDALTNVFVYVPAAVYDCPFHIYGNWLLQIFVLVVLVKVELTVRFSVAMLSQPAALISVFV